MTEASYQTAPLTQYSDRFRDVAEELFHLVEARIDRGRGKRFKGSYSVIASTSSETAAKIIIYERHRGKRNGDWPPLCYGVYVLIRSNGRVGEEIWNNTSFDFQKYFPLAASYNTIGVAPKHEERFVYFPVMAGERLEDIADFLTFAVGVAGTAS